MPDTSFTRALEENRVARRLGDARLSYDAPVLVARTVPSLGPADLLPEALLVVAAAAAVLALTWIAAPDLRRGSGPWVAAGLVTAAAVALGAALGLGVRQRGRRGFAVNFATHVLRIDRPAGLRRLTRAASVPFASVQRVEVEQAPGGRWALSVQADGQREVLVSGVPPREREQLDRLARMLEGAFGLSPTPPSSAGGGSPPSSPRPPPT
jgi:hypothetical protein